MNIRPWACGFAIGCALLCGARVGTPSARAADSTEHAKAVHPTKAACAVESVSFSSRTYQLVKDKAGNDARKHTWSAYVTLYADRRIEGSHLSGDPPFVHQEKSTLSKDAFAEVWKAARGACAAPDLPNPGVDPGWITYEELTIIVVDGADAAKRSIETRWQVKPVRGNAPAAVKGLVEALLKHRVGGW